MKAGSTSRGAMVSNARLPQQAIDGLRRHFAGSIILPGDSSYEEGRRVWNYSIDRHPALILRPAGVKDVATAVRFGRDHELLVAVRGGGHSVAGFSTCDDGLVIDLSAMKGVRVDPQAMQARVQAGCLWGEVDRATQEFGIAVTGGLISSTGVAGFTLGGGLGWLQRKLGLACDNLMTADVVTADGDLLHVSKDTNADLLWALKGGGGNFGIVTSFDFELHPIGPEIMGGLIFFPGERAQEVLAFFSDFYPIASDDLTLAVVLRLAPEVPFLPEEMHGKPLVAIAAVHAGDPHTARRDLKQLRDLGRPLADLVTLRPYLEMQSLLDAGWMPGFQNYWKAEYLAGMPVAAIEVLTEHLATITSPLSDFKLMYLGGEMARVGENDTAYGHRDAWTILNINSRWSDPEDSERHVDWTRRLWQAMQPHSHGGTYVNFASADEGHRVRGSYGSPSKYERLTEIKQRYDPTNLFRLNQNIEPKGETT